MTREQWRKEFWKRLERAYADKDNARFDKEKRLNKNIGSRDSSVFNSP